ncbi:hypothetical protein F909_03905 [Acinetobacter sp. ANC 3929]|uniref:Bbp19 family protein n=1 Tax=Acinetobacter sp. ANC 3929 TaxID=1217707 RepID=UPI0002CD88A0|nr:hypothetical protein [Acinetobacter sp. ANC 3929]ENW78219.1 hypothetical protein F909_03905 [Acinetobacter sp. ANC 3929]
MPKSQYELQREQEVKDIESILATDFGKRFLMRLIERAKLYEPTYANGAQPTDFAFLEGRREFGLFLLAEITTVSTDAWLDMQKMRFKQIQETEERAKNEREQQRASDND